MQHAKAVPLKDGRANTTRRTRWPRSFWLWSIALVVVIVLVLWGHSAAAQTYRGAEIIQRALALKADTKHGAELYGKLCASCHGKTARGSAQPVTPALAGQLQAYVIKQLADLAEGDRAAPEMHRVIAVKEVSTPQAMRDLASYVNGLAPNPSPERGDGKQLVQGESIFRRSCAQCHGSRGEGDDRHAVPSLQHQHYSYLLMQMRQLAVGHRYSVDIDVIETLEALTFDQLTAVADYASRLPSRASDPIAALQ